MTEGEKAKVRMTSELVESERPLPGTKIAVETLLPGQEYRGKYIVVWINDNPTIAFVMIPQVAVLAYNHVHFAVEEQFWIKDSYYGEVTHWSPLP